MQIKELYKKMVAILKSKQQNEDEEEMDPVEAYVREHGFCSVHALPLSKTPWWGYKLGHHVREWEFDTPEEAYAAAKVFTDQRLEEIANAKKAVDLLVSILQDPMAQHYEETAEIYRQIAVREKARLDALREKKV